MRAAWVGLFGLVLGTLPTVALMLAIEHATHHPAEALIGVPASVILAVILPIGGGIAGALLGEASERCHGCNSED